MNFFKRMKIHFISFACFILLSESKKVFHRLLEFLTDFIEKRGGNGSIFAFQISYMSCGDIQALCQQLLLQIRFPDNITKFLVIK